MMYVVSKISIIKRNCQLIDYELDYNDNFFRKIY